MVKAKDTARKEYSLKDVEVQMFSTIDGLKQTAMSNFASFILIERMAYPVTANSRFEIDFAKKSIKVWEEAPAEEAKAEVIS